MRRTTLHDGQPLWCLKATEARVLDHHVQGYLDHGVRVEEGDVVLDVGANIGIFGVRAVQRHPGVRVFAFEPIPEIHDVLAANARDYGDGRLVPLQCGVSDKPGTATFTYFPRSPALSTASPEAWEEDPEEFEAAVTGTTREPPPDLWYLRLVPGFLSPLLARFLKGGAQEITCELRTLSDVIDEHGLDRVDLLKVDCEGAELPALRGLRDEHWARVSRVVVEVHDRDGALQEVLGILDRQGFVDVVTEKEDGFEDTRLVNVYASRGGAAAEAR